MRTFERRVLPSEGCKILRANDKTGELTFRGRPWVYGQQSDDLGGWAEIVEEGAATRTLAKDPDVRFLVNHDSNLLLARTSSGTLTLSEDDEGGVAEANMANVTYARDLAELIERGDMTQMSFGFWVTSDSWAGNLHVVREFDLDGGDVSAVTYPAYPQTSAELRSALRDKGLVQNDDEIRPDVERALREIAHGELEELRAGKVLSSGNEDLVRQAIEALTALIEKAAPATEEEGRSLGLDLLRLRQMETGITLREITPAQ